MIIAATIFNNPEAVNYKTFSDISDYLDEVSYGDAEKDLAKLSLAIRTAMERDLDITGIKKEELPGLLRKVRAALDGLTKSQDVPDNEGFITTPMFPGIAFHRNAFEENAIVRGTVLKTEEDIEQSLFGFQMTDNEALELLTN